MYNVTNISSEENGFIRYEMQSLPPTLPSPSTAFGHIVAVNFCDRRTLLLFPTLIAIWHTKSFVYKHNVCSHFIFDVWGGSRFRCLSIKQQKRDWVIKWREKKEDVLCRGVKMSLCINYNRVKSLCRNIRFNAKPVLNTTAPRWKLNPITFRCNTFPHDILCYDSSFCYLRTIGMCAMWE